LSPFEILGAAIEWNSPKLDTSLSLAMIVHAAAAAASLQYCNHFVKILPAMTESKLKFFRDPKVEKTSAQRESIDSLYT